MTVSLTLSNFTIHSELPIKNPTWKDKIQKVPVIGHIIQAITWLFKKIFPCCFASKPQALSLSSISVESLMNNIALEILPTSDLKALEVNLAKLKTLHEKINETLQMRKAISAILKRNPNWKTESGAWNVSLEDKLWLLRLHECHLYSPLPFILQDPSNGTPTLLTQKTQIEQFLLSVKRIEIRNKSLNTCPDFLELLSNLEILFLDSNNFTRAPDLSKNPNLEYLNLNSNKLTSPPIVSCNKQLKDLWLRNNQLTSPPETSNNSKLNMLILDGNRIQTLPNSETLTILSLENNGLTTALNFSKFKKLIVLNLQQNQFTIPPDVSQNRLLKILELAGNQLKTAPDLSNNLHLNVLDLRKNNLSVAPDLSHNKNLTELYLSKNQITVPPDLRAQTKLEDLRLAYNQLTQFPNLDNHPKLNKLYLSRNQISDIPDLQDLDFKELKIRKNPLSANAKVSLIGLQTLKAGSMIIAF